MQLLVTATDSCRICNQIATGQWTQLIVAIFATRIFAVSQKRPLFHTILIPEYEFYIKCPNITFKYQDLAYLGKKIGPDLVQKAKIKYQGLERPSRWLFHTDLLPEYEYYMQCLNFVLR